MAKKLKGQLPSDLADNRFVRALIDRLVSNEKLIAVLRNELSEFQERWAEQQPWLLPDGTIRFKNVLEADGGGSKEFTVIVQSHEVKPE